MSYHLTDYFHFACMYWRNRRRQQVWGKLYEEAVRTQSFKLPVATVVQLIPTEACNLRCPFCNQWGENGYFFDGVRQVQHMDEDSLTKLMRGLSPRDSLISVHGGEPFVYKHSGTLLELLREQQFDVIFSTNGTLLKPYLEQLARIRIIAGNVFHDGFNNAFNSDVAIKFRKHMLTNRLPICNRCCGLYMTNPARKFEQKARRNLGLNKEVTVHFH